MMKDEHERHAPLAEIGEEGAILLHYGRLEGRIGGALQARPIDPAAVHAAQLCDVARVFGPALFVVGGAVEDVAVFGH